MGQSEEYKETKGSMKSLINTKKNHDAQLRFIEKDVVNGIEISISWMFFEKTVITES